jgi:hypothetical protein
MRPLRGERLLLAWEQGTQADDLRRPLILLSIALPDRDPVQLAAIPITERNALLLQLHKLTFGPELNVFGACPDCGALLEFSVPADAPAAQFNSEPTADVVTWESHGQRYRLRPVTTDDLVACLDVPELDASQDLLLSRCLEMSPAAASISPADAAVSPADAPVQPPAALPSPLPAHPEVLQKFEELHGAAELSCAIDCPGCATSQVLDLDLARFVWAEVRTAARRLIADIHGLASAYGWSEQSIASMSPTRRGAYLELIGA